MGFLHNLWDETLAGPTPDSGVGKNRKYKPLRLRSASSNIDPSNADEISPVSRSITILRSNSLSASSGSGSGSSPSSPSSPVTPGSPFSPTSPGGNIKKLTRAKSTAGGRTHSSGAKHPTGYDWIVLSALDR